MAPSHTSRRVLSAQGNIHEPIYQLFNANKTQERLSFFSIYKHINYFIYIERAPPSSPKMLPFPKDCDSVSHTSGLSHQQTKNQTPTSDLQNHKIQFGLSFLLKDELLYSFFNLNKPKGSPRFFKPGIPKMLELIPFMPKEAGYRSADWCAKQIFPAELQQLQIWQQQSLLPFSFLFVFVKNIKRVRQVPDHLKGGITHSTHCYVKTLFLLFILKTATLSEGQIHIFP